MGLRRVGLAYAASILGVVNSLLSNVWLMREVSAVVSKAELGLFVACTSAITCLGLLQGGLDFVGCQRMAETLARGRVAEARRVYGQMVWFNRTLGAALLAVTAVVTAYLAGQPPPADLPPNLLPSLIGLLGAVMAVGILAAPAAAAITASQSLHVVHLTRLAGGLSSVTLSYVLLRFGAGIYCLPVSQLVVGVVLLAVFGRLRGGRCPWTDGSVDDRWAGFAALVRFSAAQYVVMILYTIEGACEPLVLAAVVADPLPHLATYSLWGRFPALAVVFCAGPLTNALPTLAAAFAVDHSRGVALFHKLFGVTVGLAAVGVTGVGLWLTPVVHHWLGGQYDLPDGVFVAAAAALIISFKVFAGSITTVLYPLQMTRAVVVGTAIIAFGKVAAGLVLAPFAPVLGMTAAWAVGLFAAYCYYAAVLHRLGVYPFARSAALVVLVCGLTAAAAWAGRYTATAGLVPTAVGMAGTGAFLGGMVFVVGCWTGVVPERWYRRFLPGRDATGRV